MSLPKRYKPSEIEPFLIDKWQREEIYNYQFASTKPVFSIDTPPATVSGKLHLGHTFSYSHPDFVARFHRMNGFNIFYPMGFDDNGLPTGRLVEIQLGHKSTEYGRREFIEKCLQVSEKYENEYQELWQQLGLSIDWRYTYRTNSADSRKISQVSFLNLLDQGLVYRKEAPTIWCPECETAIAQAEMEDKNQRTEFLSIKFPLLDEKKLNYSPENYILISTTRPELLPACVAIFVHPDDKRHEFLVGQKAIVPLFNQVVPILADIGVEPDKGTGIVMCCTFGDQMDVAWWNQYDLPLVDAIDQNGRLTSQAGNLRGFPISEARKKIRKSLSEKDILSGFSEINHSVRVHERCHTAVEYIVTPQWFVSVLDHKDALIEAGQKIRWHPPHMLNRFVSWVENLNWDWCISRQRYFGVPFPIWYCKNCDQISTAKPEQLPLDPMDSTPTGPCSNCGCDQFIPETDVMDTWATSSLTPQIAGRWLKEPCFYQKLTPYSLRPQAHEIIRTWTFYTILKTIYHFDSLPWENILISGWGIAGEGMGKISKSRGGGPVEPLDMIQSYSADAVRYWSSSTAPGKDSVISEEKIKTGQKLVNKIWNVARFSAPFIEGYSSNSVPKSLTTADKWILSKIQKVIQTVTNHFENYDYAAAKAEVESFLWLYADNYVEMVKQRLYNPSPFREGAIFTINYILLVVIKLFAPIMPFVTEQIYLDLFSKKSTKEELNYTKSIHISSWPIPKVDFIDDPYEAAGDLLIEIATQIRRYKSEHALPLNTKIKKILLQVNDFTLSEPLEASIPDLQSITRATSITINEPENTPADIIAENEIMKIKILP